MLHCPNFSRETRHIIRANIIAANLHHLRPSLSRSHKPFGHNRMYICLFFGNWAKSQGPAMRAILYCCFIFAFMDIEFLSSNRHNQERKTSFQLTIPCNTCCAQTNVSTTRLSPSIRLQNCICINRTKLYFRCCAYA